MTKSKLTKKGVDFILTARGPLSQEVRAETLRQELMQKPQRVLPKPAIYTSRDHQPRGDTHRKLGPPALTIDQKNVPWACSHTNLVGAFSLMEISQISFFPNDSS